MNTKSQPSRMLVGGLIILISFLLLQSPAHADPQALTSEAHLRSRRLMWFNDQPQSCGSGSGNCETPVQYAPQLAPAPYFQPQPQLAPAPYFLPQPQLAPAPVFLPQPQLGPAYYPQQQLAPAQVPASSAPKIAIAKSNAVIYDTPSPQQGFNAGPQLGPAPYFIPQLAPAPIYLPQPQLAPQPIYVPQPQIAPVPIFVNIPEAAPAPSCGLGWLLCKKFGRGKQ